MRFPLAAQHLNQQFCLRDPINQSCSSLGSMLRACDTSILSGPVAACGRGCAAHKYIFCGIAVQTEVTHVEFLFYFMFFRCNVIIVAALSLLFSLSSFVVYYTHLIYFPYFTELLRREMARRVFRFLTIINIGT